jgi:hypothetical protein
MELETPLFSSATGPESGDKSPVPRPLPIEGKENLTVSISGEVLREARRLKGQIAISQVVEQALAGKIREIQHPEKERLLRRLRTEKDERKGPLFAKGLTEGRNWARDTASWGEIKTYASYTSSDVAIVEPEDEPGWQFVGQFRPPWDDYPNFSIVDDDGNSVWQAGLVQQFWRGWVNGVRSIYQLVKDELEEPETRDVDPEDIPF